MATLMQTVQGYVRNQKTGGNTGLVHLVSCIEHMFGDSHDWTPLAWLVGKSQTRDAQIFRAILGRVTENVTVSKDPKQPSGLRFKTKGNASTNEMYAVLKALADAGESFRGEAVKVKILDKEKTETTFDLEAYAKRIVAKLDKEHVGLAALLMAVEKAEKASHAEGSSAGTVS